jgi:hypothetical protein
MRASSCANTTTRLARSVNRSNMMIAPSFSVRLSPCWPGPSPTSLTLVGRALSCLVPYSWQAPLSATRMYGARLDRQRVASGYNPRSTARYSPLPVAFSLLPRDPPDRAPTRADTLLAWPGTASALGETCSPRAQRRGSPDAGGLPAGPDDSGSERRPNTHIRREPSRTPPAPLPRRGRGY